MGLKTGNHRDHKFYGSATVGERGQVVIPAEARRDFDITPATKLLVFGGQGGEGLMFAKAESMTEFLAKAKNMMSQMEEMLAREEEKSTQKDGV